MKLMGRREIIVDAREVNQSNLAEIISKVYLKHEENRKEIEYLLNFEKGDQPLQRVKMVRPEINVECIDNVANQAAVFNVGFKWGNSIAVTQRGNHSEKDQPESVALLNDCYNAEGVKSKTQELGRFVEICGVGYTFVDVNTEYEDGDSYFTVDVLDPRCTFVIRSNYYVDKRIICGVTYRVDDSGVRHYSCFTKNARMDIDSDNISSIIPNIKTYINPIGRVPIVEWVAGYDRMGVFERQIDEMNNLNLMISDFANSVDQNTQAIWHCNDVDFPEVDVLDENGKVVGKTIKRPSANSWLQTYTTNDGRSPFVKPLSIENDYAGMLNNIFATRQRILEKCHVPQRNDNSGGSTGTATNMATGWEDAENVASIQQSIMEDCKMEELRCVLNAIRKSSHVPKNSPLLSLKITDIQPSIKRRKTSELTTKVNFFATAVSHGINGLHALKAMDAFPDVNQVWEDSKDMIEKYQSSVFDKETVNTKDRIDQDASDQIVNSPFEDGIRANGRAEQS